MHAWGAFHCSAEPYGTLRRPLFPHDSRARVHWRPDEADEAVFLCIDPAPAKPHGACQGMVHARLADEWPGRGIVRWGLVEGRVRYDERRSEERRVGKECASTVRSRWTRHH